MNGRMNQVTAGEKVASVFWRRHVPIKSTLIDFHLSLFAGRVVVNDVVVGHVVAFSLRLPRVVVALERIPFPFRFNSFVR